MSRYKPPSDGAETDILHGSDSLVVMSMDESWVRLMCVRLVQRTVEFCHSFLECKRIEWNYVIGKFTSSFIDEVTTPYSRIIQH